MDQQLETFLSDVNDPLTAKPAPPCCFTQAKSVDDVEKAKQAAIKHAEWY